MKKKMMKWKLGVALSLTLFAGFAALDARPSEAVGRDVFDADTKLYVPYWRVDADTATYLILENVTGPGANAVLRFYDKDCKFIKDYHTDLTTDDVDLFDVSADILHPTTGEGGLIATTTGFGVSSPNSKLTAETIVIDLVDGSVIRFPHINENDAGFWTTFENFWTGTYFDASVIDNELFLFCPKKKASGETINRLADDLLQLADSPVGDSAAFTTGVDMWVFDDFETILVSIPLNCSCVTRNLLHNLTSLVVGTNGRIEVKTTTTGFDQEDFIAYMKRSIHGTPQALGGYMFSN